jgi:hypothetical protein
MPLTSTRRFLNGSKTIAGSFSTSLLAERRRELLWKLTKKRLKRGVFRSLQQLKDAIHRFLDDTNANPKPFTWTKDPNKIVAAVKRGGTYQWR